MKDKIEGYELSEIIKNYQKIEDKIIVLYLDGNIKQFELKQEQDILFIMEKQGKDFAKEWNNKNKYYIKVISSSGCLCILLFTTLHAMEVLTYNGILLGSIIGSGLLAMDIIGFKQLFTNISSKIPVLENQEKYNFYFNNKDILENVVSINELDNISLEHLKKIKRKR